MVDLLTLMDLLWTQNVLIMPFLRSSCTDLIFYEISNRKIDNFFNGVLMVITHLLYRVPSNINFFDFSHVTFCSKQDRSCCDICQPFVMITLCHLNLFLKYTLKFVLTIVPSRMEYCLMLYQGFYLRMN
jgi:hypothetical protein